MDKDLKRQFDALYQGLQDLQKERNRITVQEFSKYAPLFRKNPGLSESDIQKLSDEFKARFDLYEDIVLLDATGSEVLRLPKLFHQLRSTDPRFDDLVNKARGDIHSDIPKYSAEALSNVINAFMVSQTIDKESFKKAVEEAKESYIKAIQEFNEKMNNREPISEEVEGDAGDVLEW